MLLKFASKDSSRIESREILTKKNNMETMYKIRRVASSNLLKSIRIPYYCILIFDGKASFSIDFKVYNYEGKAMVLLSPNQFLQWLHPKPIFINTITFHNDFHNMDPGKNINSGNTLFKNISKQPYLPLTEEMFRELKSIIEKMKYYEVDNSNFNHAIFQSYLQLILVLALSNNKELHLKHKESVTYQTNFEEIRDFNKTLEDHFINMKDVSFYASCSGLSVGAFSKKIKKIFGRPPSKIIQERIVLEAKRMLYSTSKPIKEIAASLNFEDAFYFSRYFKKEVGISPKKFREEVGHYSFIKIN